ncbi:L,D-transpeptidase family protein [uncultured Cohaesibacter sp.]|uniref:L,D-transpeptidase family protein n=1 Tax=uncultured Cohaesibacter sp. TaxID=1002546 RepID=UPI00292CF4C5|nr:L,D-transpeptidase family protein [uncultured Cohaesibacter sp.]
MSSVEKISIRAKPGCQTKGLIVCGSYRFPCALGRSGISIFKKEGNGATPVIRTRALYGFYRPDREARPRSTLAFHPLRPDMGWCDDSRHPSYNRLVRRPFEASHEIMWRDDSLYDLVIVLDINITSRIKDRGSAIFMHVARENYTPTEGCIALSKANLKLLLKHLSDRTMMEIAQ